MFPCSFSFRVYFNPLPPHGGRRLRQTVPQSRARFQSTPSAWRETSSTLHNCGSTGYFNPLPPHGGRRVSSSVRPPISSNFNPLPPHGGRLSKAFKGKSGDVFQSTPSAWRETSSTLHNCGSTGYFNPLPPHGGRPFQVRQRGGLHPFQSTPSAWRETLCPGGNMVHIVISIHSLRMEGDCRRRGRGTGRGHFNPLPPHGGRHLPPRRSQHGNYFNPLPPHGGRLNILWVLSGKLYFNPLPPHGGRRRLIVLYSLRDIFQSTPSAWRETDTIFPCLRYLIFQSTPSAWRETGGILGKMRAGMHFNPLPPHGGRRTVCGKRFRIEKFQSTPSAWRETRLYLRLEVFFSYFNPLPPHGGRRTQRRAEASGRAISIHSLRMEGDPTWKQSVIRLQDFNPLPPHGGRRNDLPEVTQ